MKKVLMIVAVLASGLLFLGFKASASSTPVKFYDPATIFFEDFEGSTNVADYDHFYTGHEAEIITEHAISGHQSLATYVTDAPGPWVDTLAIKKDFLPIQGPNAFLVTGKIHTTNYQQMMVEVRKNYDGHGIENMPYEFLLTINESAKTLGRPCFQGWYNACALLNIYNEVFHMDQEGVIHFEFEFSSNEPVVLSFRGVIANLSEVAIMTFDNLSISEKPIMSEDFEVVMGNFWEATAFWANHGGIETDLNKVIDGNQSLRYNIVDWTLGGITNTKFKPPQEVPLRLSFELRAENGKVFLLATPWSPIYFEFQYDFETNTLSHPGLSVASATLVDGILYASMEFVVPASADLQTFNFYGSRLNEGEAGFYYLDNFKVEVLQKTPIVVPQFQVGYAITKSEQMLYRMNLRASDVLAFKDAEGEPLNEGDYTLSDFQLLFNNEYLNTLEARQGHVFTLETTYGDVEIVLDIYDVRPIVTPGQVDYAKSLLQDVILGVDLVDHDFVSVALDQTLLEAGHYAWVSNNLVIKAEVFQALEAGNYHLTIVTAGGIRHVPVTVTDGLVPIEQALHPYQMGDADDLEVAINIPASIITGVTVGGQTLDTDHYVIEANALIIKSSYLNTQPAGLLDVVILTATEGVSFPFQIEISVLAPTTDVENVTFDVFVDQALNLEIDLAGLSLTEVKLGDTVLTSDYQYVTDTLIIDEAAMAGLVLGTYTLKVSTAGGSVEIQVQIVNSAGLNDVIIITVPQTVVNVQRGDTYDPNTDISHQHAVGAVTVTLSSHLNTNVSGRYVVTMVIEDAQGNQSFAYYVVLVSGATYRVTITYHALTQERSAIDEAILDFDRKSYFRF